jgi:hypothetical protein
MLARGILFASLFSSLTGLTWAGPIIYTVTVNTTPVSGQVGSLDFNFNPGPLTAQAASLNILNFSGDGVLAGSPQLTGDIAGTLPGTLAFDNGAPFNDYFEGFTFGTVLSFDVSLFGPALSSPDGISTSGSTFAFSMFGDAAGTIPVLTTDIVNGFAFVVNVNLDGTTTATSFIQTPEPDSWMLVATAMALGALCLWRRFGGVDARN